MGWLLINRLQIWILNFKKSLPKWTWIDKNMIITLLQLNLSVDCFKIIWKMLHLHLSFICIVSLWCCNMVAKINYCLIICAVNHTIRHIIHSHTTSTSLRHTSTTTFKQNGLIMPYRRIDHQQNASDIFDVRIWSCLCCDCVLNSWIDNLWCAF